MTGFQRYYKKVPIFVPIANHSFACSANTAGMLSLAPIDVDASSDRVFSRRTDAAIDPVSD